MCPYPLPLSGSASVLYVPVMSGQISVLLGITSTISFLVHFDFVYLVPFIFYNQYQY